MREGIVPPSRGVTSSVPLPRLPATGYLSPVTRHPSRQLRSLHRHHHILRRRRVALLGDAVDRDEDVGFREVGGQRAARDVEGDDHEVAGGAIDAVEPAEEIDDGSALGGAGAETIEFGPCDQYTIQGDLFSRAVREGTEQPVPLEDAVGNMAVIDAVFRSAESGRWEAPG